MAHMDVLLREDVDNLGHRGQVVRVRAGYGRNYLLPQGLAIEATPGNKRMIEEQQRILDKREKREHASAQTEAQRLDGVQLRFDRRVGEHGMLYGSVTALDIAEALKNLGHTVERRRIGLREPIKEVGDYDVVIKLHRDVAPTVKVRVRKEGAPDEEAAAETSATESSATENTATENAGAENTATENAEGVEAAAGAESESGEPAQSATDEASPGEDSTASRAEAGEGQTE